ncbi:MAG: DUF2249 domain-containing protein [Nitrospiraceae bacterium]|nr:DUF2249 domain-containing protein [Nitrospiraceae bacterium]
MPENIMKELDVSKLLPPQRHPLIFQTFDGLQKGDSFLLINDHDPKPLWYQFLHERENMFSWEYVQQGPDLWKVKITKKA